MKQKQAGVAIVEFALIAVIFFSVLLAILDFGRILFTWNSVAEATRWGARTAVVCNRDSSAVLKQMQKIVPSLTAANVAITWYGSDGSPSTSCTYADCTGVSVSVKDVALNAFSPISWIGFSTISSPGFFTFLPREIMGQDPNSSSVCAI